MPDQPPILAFDAVSTEVDLWPAGELCELSFAVRAGELALIRFDRRDGHGPIPDVAMGLVEPETGDVRIHGEPWSALRPAEASRARGQIGRYFGYHGWVKHLDVDENVTLRERHHTRRPLSDIADEADRLARAMGLANGLPTGRPAAVDPRDLQRAACVRMLLGGCPLILFDEPAGGLPPALTDAVAAEIRVARGRGVAVVWLTADAATWQDRSLDPTLRLDRTGCDDGPTNPGARQQWQSPSSSAT